MAESLKDAIRTFDAEAFRSAVLKINREKEKAAEYVSAAGAETKNAVDKLNLNKTSLTFVAKLARKESDEQSSVAETVIVYMHAAGFFDQATLEGGAIEVMRQIVADADAGTPSQQSAVVTSLTRGAAAH